MAPATDDLPSAWPAAAALDDYLREVVVTLKQVVDQGIRHIQDEPASTDASIADCVEMLGVIMQGDVAEWVVEAR
jgi:hypothetical protein